MGGLDTEVGVGGNVARRFGAFHALLAFVLVFLAQIGAGAITVIAMLVWRLARGENPNDARVVQSMLDDAVIPLVIASSVATVIVTLALTFLWAGHLVRDRGPDGLGIFTPPPRQLLLCIAVGIVCGVLFVTSVHFFQTDFRGGGPLAKVASAGGTGRVIWVVLAVLIAPPIEELLFRGLMLRGLMTSWGTTIAGVIVTVLFFVLHLFEAIGYWPAMIAIFALSLATLFARLRTGSVIAATALHAAYNAVLAVAVYALA